MPLFNIAQLRSKETVDLRSTRVICRLEFPTAFGISWAEGNRIMFHNFSTISIMINIEVLGKKPYDTCFLIILNCLPWILFRLRRHLWAICVNIYLAFPQRIVYLSCICNFKNSFLSPWTYSVYFVWMLVVSFQIRAKFAVEKMLLKYKIITIKYIS